MCTAEPGCQGKRTTIQLLLKLRRQTHKEVARFPVLLEGAPNRAPCTSKALEQKRSALGGCKNMRDLKHRRNQEDLRSQWDIKKDSSKRTSQLPARNLRKRFLFRKLNYTLYNKMCMYTCAYYFKNCFHCQNMKGNFLKELAVSIFSQAKYVIRDFYLHPQIQFHSNMCVFIIATLKGNKNIQPLYKISHHNTDSISGECYPYSLKLPPVWLPH